MSPRRLRKKLLLALLLWLTALPAFSQAAMPLVDTAWLRENLDNPSLRILDLLPVEYYRQVHIPRAVNTDYNQWRATGKNGVPKMLPDIHQLERLIGSLGIDNDTHVVIAPPGQGAGDVAVATRIYWTLHLLGHRKLSILDGGLIGYLNDRSNPVDRGVVKPEPASFTAAYREPDHPQAAQVLQSLDSGHSMLDARSPEEYFGKMSGGPRERPGRIPGAVNLPYDSLVKPGSGYFPPVESLRSIFEQADIPLEGEQIAYCHTGHRASVAWFVAHELLGNEQMKLYDGSTVEWATDPDLPLER